MTIPIIPGPFSFLQELGRGVGTAFQVAEQQKRVLREQAQEDRAEASKNLMSMLELYSKGVLKKIDTDAILELGGRAGIGDFLSNNVVPRPENQIAEGQSQFLSSLLGNQTQGEPSRENERRQTLATGKIPTSAELAQSREQTARATTRADVIERGGAAGRAVAEVPEEKVAVAGEQTARDVFYNSQAGRSADAAIGELGGDILKQDLSQTIETAWAKAQNDARTRGEVLDESLTRPYIEAAVAQRYRERLTEEARVRASAARGTDTYDDYLRILQGQQQQVRQQIQALPEPSPQTYMFAQAYEAQVNTPRTPEEQKVWEAAPATAMLRSAYESTQNYKTTIDMLNTELNGYRDQLNNALGGKIEDVGGATPGREQRKLSDKQVDAVIQRMRKDNISPEQVDKDVKAGLITAADGAAIKERLQTGAGGRF